MAPVISIYTTIYNNADIVEKSLSSVIKLLPDFDEKFELVVVDNYSTDGTYEKLLKLQKKHQNIKIIQQKCSRGKGRAIAFSNTSGKYVLSIDCDTIYLEPFKNIVYSYPKMKDMEMYPCFFTKRKTMEFIGNFRDLNYAEDVELTTRSIAKGVKVYSVPCKLSNNQINENREKRYSHGLKYLFRKYRNHADGIAGAGENLFDFLERYKVRGRKETLIPYYFALRLRHPRLFRYFDTSNLGSLFERQVITNPAYFKINKKYYFFTMMLYGQKPEDIASFIQDMLKIGFNILEVLKGKKGKYLFLYNDKASRKLIAYQRRMFRV